MKKLTVSFSSNQSMIIKIIAGLVLLVASTIAIVAFGSIVDHVPFLVSFDTFFYEKIHLGFHAPWLNALVAPFNFNFLPWGGTFIPSFLYFLFLFGLVYIAIRHRREFWWVVIGLGIAIWIDSFLFKITNTYVVRDRPFLHLLNQLTDTEKNIWVHWPTYPSGHVRDTAFYSTVIAGFAEELRWPFIVFTLWMVFTRIYLGAHYPTDAFAGWVEGYFAGISILWVLKPIRIWIRRVCTNGEFKIKTPLQ